MSYIHNMSGDAPRSEENSNSNSSSVRKSSFEMTPTDNTVLAAWEAFASQATPMDDSVVTGNGTTLIAASNSDKKLKAKESDAVLDQAMKGAVSITAVPTSALNYAINVGMAEHKESIQKLIQSYKQLKEKYPELQTIHFDNDLLEINKYVEFCERLYESGDQFFKELAIPVNARQVETAEFLNEWKKYAATRLLDKQGKKNDSLENWLAHVEIKGLENLPNKITVDPLLLGSMLENLASNASKYATRMTLTCQVVTGEDGKQMLSFRLDDNGGGIPQKVLGTIGKYRSNESGKTGKDAASGIGMFVTRRYTEELGGTLRFGNRNPARQEDGAFFEIQLPLEFDQQATKTIGLARNLGSDERAPSATDILGIPLHDMRNQIARLTCFRQNLTAIAGTMAQNGNVEGQASLKRFQEQLLSEEIALSEFINNSINLGKQSSAPKAARQFAFSDLVRTTNSAFESFVSQLDLEPKQAPRLRIISSIEESKQYLANPDLIELVGQAVTAPLVANSLSQGEIEAELSASQESSSSGPKTEEDSASRNNEKLVVRIRDKRQSNSPVANHSGEIVNRISRVQSWELAGGKLTPSGKSEGAFEEEASINVFRVQSAEKIEPVKPKEAPKEVKLRILVLEDNTMNQKMLARIAGMAKSFFHGEAEVPMQVELVFDVNGFEAWDRLKEDPNEFDGIFVDDHLVNPEGTQKAKNSHGPVNEHGRAFLDALRAPANANEYFAHVPVFYTSGNALSDADANSYDVKNLPKPMNAVKYKAALMDLASGKLKDAPAPQQAESNSNGNGKMIA